MRRRARTKCAIGSRGCAGDAQVRGAHHARLGGRGPGPAERGYVVRGRGRHRSPPIEPEAALPGILSRWWPDRRPANRPQGALPGAEGDGRGGRSRGRPRALAGHARRGSTSASPTARPSAISPSPSRTTSRGPSARSEDSRDGRRRVVVDVSCRLPEAGATFVLRGDDGLLIRRVEAVGGDGPPRPRICPN